MSTYLYLQKYRNTMYSKIKNYTTMFYEVYSSLGSNMYKSVSLLEWYVCDIYIFILRFLLALPRNCSDKIKGPSPFLL